MALAYSYPEYHSQVSTNVSVPDSLMELIVIATNSSSAPAHVLPGHSFPISASAIETIRYKTYGLRSRRRVAIKPRAGDLLDGSRNLDHTSDDAEDGLVRSSNEFEFDSEEGYEVDEMEEYGMI